MSEPLQDTPGSLNDDFPIIRNTPEEEALRLADSFKPITATGIRAYAEKQIEKIVFTEKCIIELARYIQESLTEENIIEAAKRLCEDYNTISTDSDDITTIWFGQEDMERFLKWCEPREKTLFD